MFVPIQLDMLHVDGLKKDCRFEKPVVSVVVSW